MKSVASVLAAMFLLFVVQGGRAASGNEIGSVPGGARASQLHNPGAVFRDCPNCPEMVVVPAGHFIMGSSATEKAWAAKHGGSDRRALFLSLRLSSSS